MLTLADFEVVRYDCQISMPVGDPDPLGRR